MQALHNILVITIFSCIYYGTNELRGGGKENNIEEYFEKNAKNKSVLWNQVKYALHCNLRR